MVGTLAGYAALPIAAGLASSLAGGASESRGTHTVAILRNAGAPILAGAGVAAVYSPETLRTRQVATCSCPASLAPAMSMKWVTAIGVITVTAVGTTFTKLSIRAVLVTVGPLPSRGAGTSSSLGTAGCSIGTLAGGIAPKAPGPRQAGLRAASRLPTFLADAGPVDGRAGQGVIAGAVCRAVESVGVGRTQAGTVRARVAGLAPAEAAVSLAHSAVQTQAVLLAARPISVLWAALVAVQALPAWQAQALPSHGVAAEAVLRVTGAGHLATEAIEAFRAQAFRAAVPGEARLAETRTVGREAAGTGGTIAGLSTILPELSHWTLFPAPVSRVAR